MEARVLAEALDHVISGTTCHDRDGEEAYPNHAQRKEPFGRLAGERLERRCRLRCGFDMRLACREVPIADGSSSAAPVTTPLPTSLKMPPPG